MKALFLTADLGGNVPPTLDIGEAVSRRGVEVEIAGLTPGRTTLPQLPFETATAIRPDGRARGIREAVPGLRLMLSRKISAEAAALVGERRADVVVVDCMVPAAARRVGQRPSGDRSVPHFRRVLDAHL